MKEKNSGISIGNILAVVGLAALAWVFGPSLLGALVGGGEVVVTAVPGPVVIVATPTLATGAPVHVVQPAPEAAAGNVPQWTGDAAVAGEAIVALIGSVTEQLKSCVLQQAADPYRNYRCHEYRDQLSQLNDQARQLAREVNGAGGQ